LAGRVLLVLAALAVLYGCGQAGSPSEKQDSPSEEKQEKQAAREDNGAPTTNFSSPDVKEGEAIELSVTNPSVGFEYAFDCNTDDVKGYDAPYLKQLSDDAEPIGYSCPPSDAGTRNVGVKIRDKNGDVTEYTDTVTIGSADLSVYANPDQSADAGVRTRFELGSFSYEPGEGPWEVTVDWGDGTPETSIQVKRPSQTFLTARHTYADDGTYTATLKVAELGSKRVGSATFRVVVYQLTPVFAQEEAGKVPHYEASQEDDTVYCFGNRCFTVETKADNERSLVLIIQDIIKRRNLDDGPYAVETAAAVEFEFQESDRDQTLTTAFAFRDEDLAEEVLSEKELRGATVINSVYFVPSKYLEARDPGCTDC
jgi:predicted small lipoprotein YifL